jgi:hypothetical protein
MTTIGDMLGQGAPDRGHLPGLDIMTVAMVAAAEIGDTALIRGAVAIIQDQGAAKDPRRGKSKEKELSNISKLTKAAKTIIDSSTTRINNDIRQRWPQKRSKCKKRPQIEESRCQISKWCFKKSAQKILKLVLCKRSEHQKK